MTMTKHSDAEEGMSIVPDTPLTKAKYLSNSLSSRSTALLFNTISTQRLRRPATGQKTAMTRNCEHYTSGRELTYEVRSAAPKDAGRRGIAFD